MSRSCHSAVFSIAVTRFPRTTRASPHTRSVRTGFRLCGIAELPFCSLPNGSKTSPTSLRWRWRISVAIRSSVPAAMASADMKPACRSRATTCVDTTSTLRPSSLHTCSSTRGSMVAWVPTAPLTRPTPASSAARPSLSSERSSSATQPATLKPNVIGSATIPCVRPAIRVRRCWTASSAAASLTAPRSRTIMRADSTIWTAIAVSLRSWLVMPRWT